ncbi:MAG: hypothetical protein JEY99_20565 [Spirochaetales bacterium]|nr:hypothetical protein [Spirochaetales bacterium]
MTSISILLPHPSGFSDCVSEIDIHTSPKREVDQRVAKETSTEDPPLQIELPSELASLFQLPRASEYYDTEIQVVIKNCDTTRSEEWEKISQKNEEPMNTNRLIYLGFTIPAGETYKKEFIIKDGIYNDIFRISENKTTHGYTLILIDEENANLIVEDDSETYRISM